MRDNKHFKVSAAIPTYNSSKYLDSCINSLKKSKFNVPKVNGQPQVGKVTHVVVIPAGFCVE